MSFIADCRDVLVTEMKFLSFMRVRPDLKRLRWHYLAFTMLATWLAGVGRYWDHPRGHWWQSAGLGSVAYVFFLALLLWILFYPLRPRNWSYSNVLIFVGMTSPPAFLYAIPVERFMSLRAATELNLLFLAIVALWRVVLLVLYLSRAAGMSPRTIVVAVPLPLALIISALSMLNLEHVVLNMMAGLNDPNASSGDDVYMALVGLTYLSFLASPILLVMYVAAIMGRRGEALSGAPGDTGGVGAPVPEASVGDAK